MLKYSINLEPNLHRIIRLTAIDVATHYIGLELVSIEFAGIQRYHVANLSGPPIITIVVNLFVLLIGIGIWFRLKWPWLFLGTLVSLVGNALPSLAVNTLAGSASEFVMAVSLLLTEEFSQRTRQSISIYS